MDYNRELIERALRSRLQDMTTMHPDLAASTLRKHVPEALARIAVLEAVLEGYRAAISYVGADSWDGCPDCIEVLKLAAARDYERSDFAMDPNRVAHALKRLRATTLAAVPMTGEGE